MTVREGSLEAPTRHPLDWRNPEFYDEREYFENSIKIGRPVFRQMAAPQPDYVSSDCPIAARHILQGMGEEAGKAEKAHPLTLLRKAYGI